MGLKIAYQKPTKISLALLVQLAYTKKIYIFNKNSPISTRLSMITKLSSALNNNSLHSLPEAELQNLSLSAWLPFQMPDRLD
jgi:hypothetical protein